MVGSGRKIDKGKNRPLDFFLPRVPFALDAFDLTHSPPPERVELAIRNSPAPVFVLLIYNE